MSLKVKLINYTPNPDKTVAMAAKICYSPVGVDGIQEKLTNEGVEKFIDRLMSMGHESPVEHCNFTFAVEGVSRVLSHQLVRHRIGSSYSQQSQRYVKLDQFEYVIPPSISSNAKSKNIYIKQMQSSQRAYNELVNNLILNQLIEYYHCEGVPADEVLQHGIEQFESFKKQHKAIAQQMEKKAIEDARYVFPNACETKIVFTMNARALLNFFKHRCCDRSQWEIRNLANEMLRQVKKVAPNVFKYAGASCVRGKCTEGKMTCGRPKTINN